MTLQPAKGLSQRLSQGHAAEHPQALAGTLLPAVLRCWRQVLGHGARPLHADSHLFEAGGDSLQLARILSRLQQQFGLQIRMQDAVQVMTPRRMARWCARCLANSPGRPLPAVAEEPRDLAIPFAGYPATANQRGLWLAEAIAGSCGLYNTAVQLHLDGELDVAALEQGLRQLLHQYPVLRSRFRHAPGQQLHAEIAAVPAQILTVEAQSATPALLETLAAQPFELARGPLWRFYLLRQGRLSHTLLICLHHAVTDAWSGRLLLQQLARHYNTMRGSAQLPALQAAAGVDTAWLQFCLAEQQLHSAEPDQALHAYWGARLAGVSGRQVAPGAARHWPFRMQQQVLQLPATAVAATAGCSPFIGLIAAFRQALHAVMGVSDCCIAIPVANRRTRAQEQSAGYYTNLLPAYDTLVPGEAGVRLLRRLQTHFLQDLDNLQLPFATLVQRLRPPLLASGNAWCDVLFVLQNQPAARVHFDGLRHRLQVIPAPYGQFPLKLEISRYHDQWMCTLEHAPECYDAAFAADLLTRFAAALVRLSAQLRGARDG